MADLREILQGSFADPKGDQGGLLNHFVQEVKGKSEFTSPILFLRRGDSNWIIITKKGIFFSLEKEQEIY